MAAGVNMTACILITLSLIASFIVTIGAERSFTIDYEHDTFLKDGQPFRYISGSIHYSRVPSYYWRDRLEKMYAAGLNAIQVYIPWNFHELTPGNFSFDGDRDIVTFLQMAHDIGFVVILRPGPYICAEWDFGGLPAWLLKDNPGIKVRTSDPDYLGPVERYLDTILPLLRPLLYVNGGPIISVQVENEYGSYFACDYDYLRFLRYKLLSHLGPDVVLFSTDGAGVGYLKCGTIEGVYSTVDFGITMNPAEVFNKSQRVFEPKGPLVNSEFYAGWLDHWGHPFVTVSGKTFAKSLDLLLQCDANVNIYMFHGGTNFGYTNGANYSPLQSHVTSYDYDAPLTEAGDITQKYLEIRKVIGKYRKLPTIPIPPSTPKSAYGKVELKYDISLADAITSGILNEPIKSVFPLTMEQVGKGQSYAYILYSHLLLDTYYPALLQLKSVRDRGYVYLDNEFQGIVTRDNVTDITIPAMMGQRLNILVENLGHINYGSGMVDNSKGLISNVTVDGTVLTNWDIFPIYLEDVIKSGIDHTTLRFQPKYSQNLHENSISYKPSFWSGKFQTEAMMDTYLDPRPFSKGHAFINGFNLGRYWPSAGPQVTLFVPKSLLKPYPEFNSIVLFEMENAPCSEQSSLVSCTVSFIDSPYLNKTTGSSAGYFRSSKILTEDYDWNREH